MSGLLIASIICFILALLIGGGAFAASKARDIMIAKYFAEYKEKHKLGENDPCNAAWYYAQEKITPTFVEWLHYKIDREKVIVFTMAFVAFAVCAVSLANTQANGKIKELKNIRAQIAETASITQHVNLDSVKAFNQKVEEVYDSIPFVDKKLFIESIESKDELFAELLIPFDEQWLKK